MRVKLFVLMFPILLLIVLTSRSACAEVALVQSDPEDGAVVAHAPKAITLRFDSAIDPAKTRVSLSEVGGRFTPALPRQPKVSGPTDHLTVVLPVLGMGSYVLRYKVVGADGRPFHGRVSFTAGGY
ncbi:copper resistance protein CopC [Geomonas sp. RF6]|uniref:copper resistance CopC family protein n=1 Tax=Geomonas sp. RF6 TaxID=2897342 RepID=UPI001E29DA30|nr:copper resistance CopC family protein [Geomonas sp. RF6]UFS71989.1 copper resistance protein CopC [Geomonas sp. RF6]